MSLRQRPAKGAAVAVSDGGAAAGKQREDAVKPRAAAVDAWGPWDWAILVALAVVAAITRFWRIDDPKSVIFDETHFNKFSTWYVSQHYYVDIHPPLAKLAFAALLWALGFKGAQEDDVRWWVPENEGGFIGTKDWMLLYDDAYGAPYLPLRQLSATVGVLFVLVLFLSGRAAGLGRVASAFLAWLGMCELVILIQSRAILCDIFLYFFNAATIGASFASARPGLTEARRVVWCLVTGVLLGCAMSVKLTALGTMAVVAVHQALVLFWPQPPAEPGAAASSGKAAAPAAGGAAASPVLQIISRGATRAAAILLPAAAIFFWLWIVHLDILVYSGQGDNFMIPEFQKTLVTKPRRGQVAPADADACPNFQNTWSDCGFPTISAQQCRERGCCWDPSSTRAWCYHRGALARPSMPLVPKIAETLRATWANNNGGAVMVHPHMSEWYEWPTMDCRTVPFAATREGGQIKALGNPAVWWGVAGCFVLVTGAAAAAAAWWLLAGRRRLVVAPAAAAAVAATLSGSSLEQRAGGWAVPLAALWAGYLLNLVPYTLIPRSKFVYHYEPALMVGAFLFAAAMDWLLAAARRSGSAAARAAAAAAAAACFGAVTAGFYYWGLPYAYGIKLSPEANAARLWNSKW